MYYYNVPNYVCGTYDDNNRSPLARGGSKGGINGRLGGLDLSESDTDISFVSSGRPSTDRMSTYNNMIYDSMNSAPNSRNSTASSSDLSFVSSRLGAVGKGIDISPFHEFSSTSFESERTSCSSQNAVVRLYVNICIHKIN